MTDYTLRHKHVCVIGRIPGEDEDSCFTYRDCSLAEARLQFANEMFCGDEDLRDATIREIGGDLGVFITRMLWSNCEIHDMGGF